MALSNVIMLGFGDFFFICLVLGIHWAVGVCEFRVFFKLKKIFDHYFFKHFCPPSSLHFWDSNYMYITRFEVTHSPFHCLKLLFPFNICVSKSLIFSFAVSYLPLIPPSVSLISGIIVLISKSCSLGLFIFFVSLLSLLNPWNTVIMKVLMSFLLTYHLCPFWVCFNQPIFLLIVSYIFLLPASLAIIVFQMFGYWIFLYSYTSSWALSWVQLSWLERIWNFRVSLLRFVRWNWGRVCSV